MSRAPRASASIVSTSQHRRSIPGGSVNFPRDRPGEDFLIVYDTGHKEERFISARAVLNDEVPAEKIEGNIFFVGTSAGSAGPSFAIKS